jgi:D-aminoacyl-tRNA deacylase
MRIVLQRVKEARVDVAGQCVGRIGKGILVLLGIGRGDTEADADYLLDKVIGLRIFHDEQGKMNRSLRDVEGALLVVSQFTLYGSCDRGRRPSFDEAMPVENAKCLCDYFVTRGREMGMLVETGVFQSAMEVMLVNDGPVTFVLQSSRK